MKTLPPMLVVGVLVFWIAVAAAQGSTTDSEKTINGTVIVAGVSLVVGGKDSRGRDAEWHFMVDESMTILKDGRPVAFDSLKRGDRVTVRYRSTRDGRAVAHSVTVTTVAPARAPVGGPPAGMTRLYLSQDARDKAGVLTKARPGADGRGFIVCDRETLWATPLQAGATGATYRISLTTVIPTTETTREGEVVADLLLQTGSSEILLGSVTFHVTNDRQVLGAEIKGVDQRVREGDRLVLRLRTHDGKPCLSFFDDRDVERMFVDTSAKIGAR